MRNIGDTVWLAKWDSEDATVPCPDCGGTGRLRVIFHDETVVSIWCQNCAVGYDPPTGVIRVHTRYPKAIQATIIGVERGPKGIEYKCEMIGGSGYYRHVEADLFADKEAAELHAAHLVSEADAAERERVLTKEKDTRSWAWNASYHRKQIKDAERQIVYHSSRLSHASLKAKAERKAKG
jgi:hypothetical protein